MFISFLIIDRLFELKIHKLSSNIKHSCFLKTVLNHKILVESIKLSVTCPNTSPVLNTSDIAFADCSLNFKSHIDFRKTLLLFRNSNFHNFRNRTSRRQGPNLMNVSKHMCLPSLSGISVSTTAASSVAISFVYLHSPFVSIQSYSLALPTRVFFMSFHCSRNPNESVRA